MGYKGGWVNNSGEEKGIRSKSIASDPGVSDAGNAVKSKGMD